jgi:uncharacterized protein
MTSYDLFLLSGMICAAAALYTSVGHAGASGYLAAMALMGVAPAVMRPTALAINILVASLATARWTGNLHNLEWRSLLPMVIASVPAAFFAGAYSLSDRQYRALVGALLLIAGVKFLLRPNSEADATTAQAADIPPLPGLATGAVVGTLSGLTGTGGGIFLTPLLLLFGRAGVRQVSGLTAPFILVNSIAALAGNATGVKGLPAEFPYLVTAALVGALIGTQVGIKWVSTDTLQRLVGVVLLIAAGKFLLS